MQIDFWIDPAVLINIAACFMAVVAGIIAIFPSHMAGRVRWVWFILIILSGMLMWWAYYIFKSLIE